MAEIVWVEGDQVDGEALKAACYVALGDPSNYPWMQDEVDSTRATIAAYLEATVNPPTDESERPNG